MKTVILYFSKHHGNTKKLVDAIAAREQVDLIDVTSCESADLSGYDVVGLASGIYAGNFGKGLMAFIEKNLPEDKPVFFLYTSASGPNMKFPKKAAKLLEKKKSRLLGKYSCYGFNTFGPFKLTGGTAKGHPDQTELDGAVAFYRQMTEEK